MKNGMTQDELSAEAQGMDMALVPAERFSHRNLSEPCELAFTVTITEQECINLGRERTVEYLNKQAASALAFKLCETQDYVSYESEFDPIMKEYRIVHRLRVLKCK